MRVLRRCPSGRILLPALVLAYIALRGLLLRLSHTHAATLNARLAALTPTPDAQPGDPIAPLQRQPDMLKCTTPQGNELFEHWVMPWLQWAKPPRCAAHIIRGDTNRASGLLAAQAADATSSLLISGAASHYLPRRPPASRNAQGYAPVVWGECESATQPGCDLVWAFFSNHCKPGGGELAEALERADIPLAVVGQGEPWRGWGYRIRRTYEWLVTVPSETIVIMSDADDVFLLPGCSREEIVQSFLQHDTDILWMAERYLWPDGSLWRQYPDIPPPPPSASGESLYKFLNAGGSIGFAGALRRVIFDVYQHDCFDDQLSFTHHFLRQVVPQFKSSYQMRGSRDANTEPGSHPNATDRVDPVSGVAVPRRPMVVKLDYYNSILMSTAGQSLSDIDVDPVTRRIRHKITGGRACILHQNGNKRVANMLNDLKTVFLHNGQLGVSPIAE